MSAPQRFNYITVAKKMTKPLIAAYQTILNINTRMTPTPLASLTEDLPLYDHVPADTHTDLPITDPDHPAYTEALADRIEELERMFVQTNDVPNHSTTGLDLRMASTTIRLTEFDICDAANCVTLDSDNNDTTSEMDVDGPF
jgi:hypothetical protein